MKKPDLSSNQLVNAIIKSKLLMDYFPDGISYSSLIDQLLIAKNDFSYISRYPKQILKSLINQEIITEKDFRSYKSIFEFFNITIKPSEVAKTGSDSPNGYFKVWVSSYPKSDEPLISEIKANFSTIVSKSSNVIYVSLEHLNDFLVKYSICDQIHWYDFCKEINIKWTRELLFKYRELWDWEYLHRNPSIHWDFEIMDENMEELNWSFISSYPHLIWNEASIDKYKDYLIFANSSNKQGKNRRGKWSSILNEKKGGYNHSFNQLKGSLSLSTTIKWTKNLIAKFADFWCWTELSSNESVPWNEDLIACFEYRVDFEALSSNTKVLWTVPLIEKYIGKWSWENLSGNATLPWSSSFIDRFETKWQWKPRYDWYYDDKTNFYPSISTNQGIIWGEDTLDKWYNKLDFWRLARVGNVSGNLIKKYHYEFDRKELIGWEHHRWSDDRESEKCYRTGWENFALNPNFKLSNEVVDFMYKRTIDITSSNGNLAHNGTFETVTHRVLDILKSSEVSGILLTDLIENEFGWSQCLLSEDFINESVWRTLISPMFVNDIHILYLRTQRLAM